jgi:MFS family permease
MPSNDSGGTCRARTRGPIVSITLDAPSAPPTKNIDSPGALVILSAAQFLIALDYSIVYIALPSIAGDLHLDPAATQWVISAYAVLFAGFLLVGGRLADRVGARRLFIVAIVLFGAASAIGGAARGGTVLLVARGAQGFGASLLQPAILGLIGSTFPAGSARSRALAVWGSVGASGLAAGAILGGLLTTASWRLTFFVNVPLTLLCALGATRYFRHARTQASVNDIPVGASVLGTGAVLSLVAGLSVSAAWGWDSVSTLILLGLALSLALAFLWNERASRNVLIQPILRRSRALALGAGAAALYMASVGAEFYLVTLLLQSARHYMPLQAGLAFLPLAAMVAFGSMAAGRAAQRHSALNVLVGGFTIAATGLVWLALALHGDSYVINLLPGMLLSGFGHGIIYISMFIVGTHETPAEHQGAAGAAMTTAQYLAGAIMVAVLTLVLGPSPTDGGFRVAFLLTSIAALAGVVLVVIQRRRLAAPLTRRHSDTRLEDTRSRSIADTLPECRR